MSTSLLSYDNFIHALSGSVANGAAMSVFYPLDTVRARLQLEPQRKSKTAVLVMKDIVDVEGFGALYKGLQPVVYSLFASGFVYFYTFHGLRRYAGEKSVVRDLLFGAVAGSVNVLTTTPLWVVNTRIKMQKKQVKRNKNNTNSLCSPTTSTNDDCACAVAVSKQTNAAAAAAAANAQFEQQFDGLIDGMVKIAQSEGVSALWSGTLPSLVLVSNPAIQFAIFETLRRTLQRRLETKQLSSFHVFALGSVAKTVSTLISYPMQIVQARKRFGDAQTKNKSIIETLAEIRAREGTAGLYKGMEAKLMQTVLTTSLMYVFYERIFEFVSTVGKSI